MADSYGFFGNSSYGGGGGSEGGGRGGGRDEDFDEAEVWSLMNENSMTRGLPSASTPRGLPTPRGIPTASRVIPRRINNPSSSSTSTKVVQHSAPVNIPDWSKIYRKNSRKGGGGGGSKANSGHGGFMDGGDDDDDLGNGDGVNQDDEDVDDDDDEDRVPPHEWIAKKLARSQISSFSVCEGVGRTLKGRDLSKVRNAVLTKTGFLE